MSIKRLLHALMFTPSCDGHWGIPVLATGEPGTGKTAQMRAVSRAAGLPVETILASIREPADFLGLPVINGSRTNYAAPGWAQRLSDIGHGVVFFDELNTAPPSVQAALLRVAHERVVGDMQLPSRVRIICAQNAIEDAAGGHETSTPFANRCCHIDWQPPTASEWSEYMLGGENNEVEEGDAAKEEAFVMAGWGLAYAMAKAVVTGFVRARPELLHRKPKSGDPACGKAWPSPRSWELATRCHATARVHGLPEEDRETLIAGCVGTGVAAELITYCQGMDLPNPADILDGKLEWKADNRIDRTVAVYAACASFVGPKNCPDRERRAGVLWGLLDKQVKDAPDLIVPAVKALHAADLFKIKGATDTVLSLVPMMQQAGLFLGGGN